jgi:CDP-diacylglycerol--glycerol-3-phosphate 3-phosphatidyltransferase
LKFWTIPNTLTAIRILLIPVFVILFYTPIKNHQLMAMGVFIIAAITDWLDGFLARYLNQTSRLGAFLDPVADKLIVLSALLICATKFTSPLFVVPALIMLCREIFITALREWMAEVGKRAKIRVSIIGKIKTCLQMIALCFFISQPNQNSKLIITGYVIFYIAAMLTIWSMIVYTRISFKQLRSI